MRGEKDKLCLREGETEGLIHINESRVYEHKHIYILPKYTADSAGMIKHSRPACAFSPSLSLLSLQSTLSVSLFSLRLPSFLSSPSQLL